MIRLLSLLLFPILAFSFEQVPFAATMKPTLADYLTIQTTASIFYSYARELELSSLFSEPNANITLLVPTNKAVMALARKPHQQTQEIHLSEQEFDKESRNNVERWVSAHIIPQQLEDIQPGRYQTLLQDKSVTIVIREGRVLLNGEIAVLDKKVAENGVMYMIDGTVIVD